MTISESTMTDVPAKKKTTKKTLSLNEFMGDLALPTDLPTDSSTSWADTMVDIPAREDNASAWRENPSGHQGQGDRYARHDDRREDRRPPRAMRDPTPLPTSPPFVAFVGNLDFNVTAADLEDYFGELRLKNVRLITDHASGRPKGFGYVEFEDLDGLTQSLSANGYMLLGRELRVDVAEGQPSRPEMSRADMNDWKRGERLPPRQRDSGFGRQDRYQSQGDDVDFSRASFGSAKPQGNPHTNDSRGGAYRATGPRESYEPRARPKLNLQPRSASAASNDQRSDAYKSGSNPFGAAKPRDEFEIQKRKEQERKSRTEPESTTPSEPKGNRFSALQ